MKTLATSLIAIALLLGVTDSPAMAQDDATITVRIMKPEVALQLAQGALERCRAEGAQVAVAVVDRFGVLQALIRDRYAGPHTPETARRKAWTAVSFRNDTLSLADATKPGSEAYGANFIEGALMLGGGVPIEVAGTLVGAAGVSGAPSGAMDDDCARAGIEEVSSLLEF
jgi:uncharacterized protein GlcG (DUF336 family)